MIGPTCRPRQEGRHRVPPRGVGLRAPRTWSAGASAASCGGRRRWSSATADRRLRGLALDHDHIREFTDHLSPTDSRYRRSTTRSSATTPSVGSPQPQHLAPAGLLHRRLRPGHRRAGHAVAGPGSTTRPGRPPASPSRIFLAGVTPFGRQSLRSPPRPGEGRHRGPRLPLPQLLAPVRRLEPAHRSRAARAFAIFSGLDKLTTAAAIPYCTGQYGYSRRGFGFVTIGANVDDFHRAATESAKRIGQAIITETDKGVPTSARPCAATSAATRPRPPAR